MRLPEACSSGDGDSGGGDASACRASCPAELYESRGMTPYDVLLDTHAMYWVADLGSVVVSIIAGPEPCLIPMYSSGGGSVSRFTVD